MRFLANFSLRNPVAIIILVLLVALGGLITSTILTLCIVPVAYEFLHWRTHRREINQLAARHA